MAIRIAKILTHLGDAVQLVVRQVFRHPVAAVVGEIKFLGDRVPIESDGVPIAADVRFGGSAVEIETADLGIRLWRDADVARRADVYIKLVVRTERHEFPSVRLMVRKIAVDDDRLRRIVEVVLDLLHLGDFRAFGDVERAIFEGETIGTIEPRRDHFDVAFTVAVDDGVDLVADSIAHEQCALVAEAH